MLRHMPERFKGQARSGVCVLFALVRTVCTTQSGGTHTTVCVWRLTLSISSQLLPHQKLRMHNTTTKSNENHGNWRTVMCHEASGITGVQRHHSCRRLCISGCRGVNKICILWLTVSSYSFHHETDFSPFFLLDFISFYLERQGQKADPKGQGNEWAQDAWYERYKE